MRDSPTLSIGREDRGNFKESMGGDKSLGVICQTCKRIGPLSDRSSVPHARVLARADGWAIDSYRRRDQYGMVSNAWTCLCGDCCRSLCEPARGAPPEPVGPDGGEAGSGPVVGNRHGVCRVDGQHLGHDL